MPRNVFLNSTVFDGENLAARLMTVVVEGARIASVSAGHVSSRVDDAVFDLGGRTLMPGMVQCHMHPDYRGFIIDGDSSRKSDRRPGVLMATAIATGHALLATGFTGYVGAGCSNNNDVELKAAIETNIILGPRIRCGSADIPLGRGLEQARTKVDEEVDHGAEVLKIFTTGGHGTPSFVPRPLNVSREEIGTVVATAEARGAIVGAHCINRDPIIDAIESGVRIIDHGDEVDDTCLRLMAENGVFWVPSALLNQVMSVSSKEEVSPDLRIEAEGHMASIRASLQRAIELGVKIVLGDDYGLALLPHAPGSYGRELTLYADELGCSALEVLRWATRNGAELLGLPCEAGTISVGAYADLIVLNVNPLDDIGVFETPETGIAAVMKDGVFFKNELATVHVAA